MSRVTGRALGLGVLGASSQVYRAVVVDAIHATDGVQLVHEASRSLRVEAGSIRRSTEYQEVLADPDVDIVYLPLPNHLHEEWVLACADAGKHILCEKPLAIHEASARRMVDGCEAAGVVLLEAYMSPFHPRSTAVQQAVSDGVVDQILHGEARMSGLLPADNHRWAVANGGGALLDVGIYCLEPILTAMGWQGGAPETVAAASRFGGDGVDETTSAWLAFGDGRTARLWVSFAAPDQQRLVLTGRGGSIEVTHHATPDRGDDGYDLRHPDGSVQPVATGAGDCYEGMVAHMRDVVNGVAKPLRDGRRSVALAGLIDRIAAAAGHQRVNGG
ncbi:hypothetical protein BH24ACT15_BH24ACT15_16960 [soil metagenome]